MPEDENTAASPGRGDRRGAPEEIGEEIGGARRGPPGSGAAVDRGQPAGERVDDIEDGKLVGVAA